MGDAWDTFTASLDPFLVEQERFRVPSMAERPGSFADTTMRADHDARRELFWETFRAVGRRAEAAEEGSRFDRSVGYRPPAQPTQPTTQPPAQPVQPLPGLLTPEQQDEIAARVLAARNAQQGRKGKAA